MVFRFLFYIVVENELLIAIIRLRIKYVMIHGMDYGKGNVF